MGSAGKLAIMPFEIYSGVKETSIVPLGTQLSVQTREMAFQKSSIAKCEEVRRHRTKRASAAHGSSRGIWISSQVMKVSPSRGVGGRYVPSLFCR
jgi:hypothetical protein